MNPTWEAGIRLAAWMFLLGTILILASALPVVRRRWPGTMGLGFLVAVASFAVVLLSWVVPRLLGPGPPG